MDIALTAVLVLALSYLCFLAQIAIHNCVHRSLFRDKDLNRKVGILLASLQLTHFEGWRSAHLLHHRFTNQEQDPHRVDRPLLPYLVTHYFRIARAVNNPRMLASAVIPPLAAAAAVATGLGFMGYGLKGLLWVVLFWLVPVIVGHLLVAHFNYITHVGMPPDRGHNTRDFTGGIWDVINKLTFGFYRHQQHHLWPSDPVPRWPTEAK